MTRQHGVVDSAVGLTPYGHLGWGYRTRAEFLARAAEFMAAGLAGHEWVEYVGAGTREQLRAELASMPGDTSGVIVTPAAEFYGLTDCGAVVDVEAVMEARGATLEKAMALGYSGIRVITDATAVTSKPEQREAFARLEFLFDRNMVGQPISVLCAYDSSRPSEAAGCLMCLHPLVGGASPAFRLYAQSGASFALSGEIDAATAGTFTATLERICPLVDTDEVVIDAVNLRFITHRELCSLDDQARRQGRQIAMRGSSPVLARLATLVDLTNIRVEPA